MSPVVVDTDVVSYLFRRDSRAEVSDGARRSGRPVGAADAWIAATAMLHERPLVTHNREHFSSIDGLRVITEAP